LTTTERKMSRTRFLRSKIEAADSRAICSAKRAFRSYRCCVTRLDGSRIGSFNFWTVGILFGTFFFPLLSIVGLVLVLRVPRKKSIAPFEFIPCSFLPLAACSPVFSCRGISWLCVSGLRASFHSGNEVKRKERIEIAKTLAAWPGKRRAWRAAGTNFRRTIHARILSQSSCETGQPWCLVHLPFTSCTSSFRNGAEALLLLCRPLWPGHRPAVSDQGKRGSLRFASE